MLHCTNLAEFLRDSEIIFFEYISLIQCSKSIKQKIIIIILFLLFWKCIKFIIY